MTKLKLPPKPQPWEGPAEWDLWGRACAEAALEEAAMECATRPPDDPIGAWYAAAIRNIEIEEE